MEPGCVEIIPRNRVTVHVRTWLLSAQTREEREGRGPPLKPGAAWGPAGPRALPRPPPWGPYLR